MGAPSLRVVNPAKKTRTEVDTILLTPTLVGTWKAPPFQRPLRVNDKVLRMVEELKANGGVVSGVITIGKLGRDTYLIDGQHRIHAYLLSELKEGFADIRLCHLEDMSEMAEEFVNLNSRLSNMRPDDFLRGMEESHPVLAQLRKRCPFIGYDMIRRGANAPLLSMSVVLRTWAGSATEVPSASPAASTQIAMTLTEDEAEKLAGFLNLALASWGRDVEYQKLWGALNLTLCMWLYRRTVLSAYSAKAARITREQFGKALMSLSAGNYIEWLVGRTFNETNRSPGFQRIKSVFSKRLADELGVTKVLLPAPAWAHNSGRSRPAGE
jgi:hypothetical protein